MTARSLFALLAASALTGCAPGATVADEVGLLGSGVRRYAVGSTIELRVLDAHDEVVLVSSDPALVLIEPEGDTFRLEARAAGACTVVAVLASEPSVVLGEWELEVLTPTDAHIVPVGEEVVATGGAQPRVPRDCELDVRLSLDAGGVPLVGRGDVALVASRGLVLEGERGTHQLLLPRDVSHVDVEARRPSGELLGAESIEISWVTE